MKLLFLLRHIIKAILLVIVLSGCVGTIKDKNASKSNVLDNGGGESTIAFGGLTKANPISHSKVELSFFPASGSQSDIVYQIYINGSPISSKISGSSIPIASNGTMTTTVSNLSLDTTYTFNIKAISTGKGISSLLDPTKALSATTFANETADFQGITSVTLAPGTAGKNTVIVRWNPAVQKSGSPNSPRATDAIYYEVKYISKTGGLSKLNDDSFFSPEKIRKLVGNGTSIPSETSVTIDHLDEDQTYYFQVRAIHKNYEQFNVDPNYKYEQNTKYLAIKTLSDSGLFSFTGNIAVNHPGGRDTTTGLHNSLTKLSVLWTTPKGPFSSYYVCQYEYSSSATFDPYTDADVEDKLKEADIFNTTDPKRKCYPVDSQYSFYNISGLDTYKYYQFKLVICKRSDDACAEKVLSDLAWGKVISPIAPFSGISTYQNPQSEATINNIKLFFDKPSTSAGYINKFKLYCYNDTETLNFTSAVQLTPGGGFSPISVPTRKACDGIKVLSTFPTIYPSDFDNFTSIELEYQVTDILHPPFNGQKKYCFSLVPVIDASQFTADDPIHKTQENLANAVTKCIIPKIETPNILQFPGRNEVCGVQDKKIQVTWPKPTGAIYSKFVMFWQKKSVKTVSPNAETLNTGLIFDFKVATQLYKSNPLHAEASCSDSGLGAKYIHPTNSNEYETYCWKEIDKIDGLETYLSELSNFTPGDKYNIAVLPLVEYPTSSGEFLWAQYNNVTGECSLPLPKAKFNEWTHVLAVGPKEDGLTPINETTGERTFYLERLNSDGQPIETNNTTSPLSSVTFNGIYGRENDSIAKTLYQHSNRGIIQLKWKDVLLYDETETLKANITSHSDQLNTKQTRKFGYRVYRSDDNKLTWKNLTSYNPASNPNQTESNAGLIHPTTEASRKINSQVTVDSDEIATFTDYSVNASNESGEIDRARIYYYKIVPVYNGFELSYDSNPLIRVPNADPQLIEYENANPNHHIIKVVLPPRNMALVNRLISNRSRCLELGRKIYKGQDEYYSCDYTGLGATPKTNPSEKGRTKLDQEGDLLVDRFELGTPFTRGDNHISGSDSKATGDKRNFNGKAQTGNRFRGCFDDHIQHEANNGIDPSQDYSYHNYMPGDCIGKNSAYTFFTPSTCSDPLHVDTEQVIFPGANGDLQGGNIVCGDPKMSLGYITDLSKIDSYFNIDSPPFSMLQHQVQGEFGSIYLIRATNFDMDSRTLDNHIAASDYIKLSETARINNSFINFPYFDSTGTKMYPRWIPTNRMFGNLKFKNTGTSIELWNKTPNEIMANGFGFYNSTTVKAPAPEFLTTKRFNKSTTPIARIISSNASKLPPLRGMAWKDTSRICSTYKIQVGYETATQAFKAINGGTTGLSKRLLRRGEFVTASAWPSQWDTAKVDSVEGKTAPTATSCQGKQKLTAIPTTGDSSISKNFAFYTDPSTSKNYYGDADSNKPLLVTGSSGSSSSQDCISKYGVQDLPGNMSEFSSEVLFCKYADPAADPMEDLAQIRLYNSPGASNGIYSGVPSDTSNTVDISTIGNTKNFDPTSVSAYVQPATKSGECSVTKAGKSVVDSNSLELMQIFKPGYKSGYSNLVSDFNFSSLSASFKENIPDDAGSIAKLRDGLGNFLEFSDKGFFTQLQSQNSFNTLTSNFHYFNPILGIPLTCDSDATCFNNDDNKIYDLVSFPYNNAAFKNTGIEQIGSERGVNTDNVYGYVNVVNNIIAGVLDGVAILGPTPSPGQLYHFYWSVSRSNAMRFISGGGVTDNPSRYSLNITGETPYEDRDNDDVGSRCAILLEE